MVYDYEGKADLSEGYWRITTHFSENSEEAPLGICSTFLIPQLDVQCMSIVLCENVSLMRLVEDSQTRDLRVEWPITSDTSSSPEPLIFWSAV